MLFVEFDQQKWLCHPCMVGIVEEAPHWIYLSIFTDTCFDAPIDLASSSCHCSAGGMAHGTIDVRARRSESWTIPWMSESKRQPNGGLIQSEDGK